MQVLVQLDGDRCNCCRPCRDLLSSVVDGAKSSFESAWSTLTTSTVVKSPVPPRGILQSGDREKPSKAHRTAFTLPSDDIGHSDSAGQVNRDDHGSNPRLSRRSMPVVPAAADAAVAEVSWRHTFPDPNPAETWRSQPASDTARHTFEWPMSMPAASDAVALHSYHSGGPTSPMSPMGAPPGPPCASDFQDWWTPDMVRERSQRHFRESCKHEVCEHILAGW